MLKIADERAADNYRACYFVTGADSGKPVENVLGTSMIVRMQIDADITHQYGPMSHVCAMVRGDSHGPAPAFLKMLRVVRGSASQGRLAPIP